MEELLVSLFSFLLFLALMEFVYISIDPTETHGIIEL